MTKKRKTGRFTVSDMAFIRQHVEQKTVDEMADSINRSPESVTRWINDNIGLDTQSKREVEGSNELRNRTYYPQLVAQFSPEELNLFDFHFKKMWSQFKDDVFHTEEMQIVDVVKLDILMNRILSAQRATIIQVDQIEADVALERRLGREDQDREYIMELTRQVGALRAAQESMMREFKEHQAKKISLIKELKGTRDQRVKSIEDSKKSWATLVNSMTVDPNFRKAMGQEMEIMRYARDQEAARLSIPIEFEDGQVDRPLLNSKSVFIEE